MAGRQAVGRFCVVLSVSCVPLGCSPMVLNTVSRFLSSGLASLPDFRRTFSLSLCLISRCVCSCPPLVCLSVCLSSLRPFVLFCQALSCPYLLEILLRVLRSLLLASERTIDQAVMAKNVSKKHMCAYS